MLLHQCLSARPNLVPVVCAKRWAIHQMFAGDLSRSLPEWSLTELIECFSTLASEIRGRYNLALFIDGLDEFSEDHAQLVEFVKDLSRRESVKICVMSRPWNNF